MDAVQAGGNPHQVLEVLEVARPPAVVEVGHIGRARHRGGDDAVAAQGDITDRHTAVQGELRRHLGHLFHDHVAVEAHAHGAVVDIGAGLDFTDRLIGYTQGRLDRAQAMLIAAEIAEQVTAARKIGGVTWGNYPGQRATML